jgi:hypothetical protein
MNIRPATLSDLNAVLELATEQAGRYPLKPDRQKMIALFREGCSSAQNFLWVVEEKGKVGGALAAFTADNLWAQRRNCNILLWVSRIPGGGAALLREFRNWVVPRRGTKVAGMSPDLEVDPRALQLAERIGFKRHGGAYLLYN